MSSAERYDMPTTDPGLWRVDPASSRIEFSLRQFLGRVRGHFTRYEMTITTGNNPLESAVSATIDLSSIDTGNAKRDKHLRGPKYLDVAHNASATYRSSHVRQTEDGLVVDGALTVFGITAPVPIHLTAFEFSTDDRGLHRAAIKATTSIRRRDFGIAVPMDGGGSVISDKILIDLDIHAALVEPQ